MTEEQAREILPIHADGELDARRASELDQALADSEELRDEFERWRALRRCAHRVVMSTSTPAGLKEAVLARISRKDHAVKFPLTGWFSGISAAAAALALVFFILQPKPASAIPMIAADRFVEIHRACALGGPHNTLGLNTQDIEQARVQLAGLVDSRVLLPDLSANGFELKGACRCFHAKNLDAVHVYYDRQTPAPAMVSLFTVGCKVCVKQGRCERCVCASGRCREYQVACANKTLVYKWDEGACSYAICGDLGTGELRALADALEFALENTGPDLQLTFTSDN